MDVVRINQEGLTWRSLLRPDARNIPILRAGDTVYIPNHKQSFTTRVKALYSKH